jgi:hypothetical protein
MRRRSFLTLLFSQAGCLRRRKPALARAAEYLWSQQAGDGGWHSHTYGLLRSGQSLTPFVLDALLQIPDRVYPAPAAKVDSAIAFLRSHTRQDGALGMADPGIPDYPNYSTALAVTALCRARRAGWQDQSQAMAGYLRRQQFTDQNGWRREDPAYGAWGMGGDRRTPPDTGHVDLSMTRYVIQALRATGMPASDPVLASARVFVERCQNFEFPQGGDADGGFFFSTTEFETNKAGPLPDNLLPGNLLPGNLLPDNPDGRRFRSYGTTTADGILALLATGCPPGEHRIEAAEGWLTRHHRDMNVPGFAGDAYRRWPHGLAFYYSSAIAEVFRMLKPDSAGSLIESLRRTQRADGSWANPENLVKEDDPLIATPFAVRALL